MKIRDRLLFACLLSISYFPLTGHGQSQQPIATRDPQALELLNKSIEVMGGRSAWQRTGSMVVSGTVSINEATPAPFHWANDWSGGSLRRRMSIGARADASTAPSGADTSGGQTSGFHTSATPFSTLLDHAPAVALEFAMRDTRYSLTLSPQPTDKSVECVQVSFLNKPLDNGGVYTLVCLSRETSLPKYAMNARPIGGAGGHTEMERFDFVAYERRHGLLFPAHVTKTLPGGFKRSYTFAEDTSTAEQDQRRGE